MADEDPRTATEAHLRRLWPDDSQFRQRMSAAYHTTQRLAGDRMEEVNQRYGNDPLFIEMMARAFDAHGNGAATAAAPAVPSGDGIRRTARESIERLQASEAYQNPRHVDHATVSRQVQQYFMSQPGANDPAT